MFVPETRDGERGYRFHAEGTIIKLLSGTVRGFVCGTWRPQQDSGSVTNRLSEE
jgi:hypothetical protein